MAMELQHLADELLSRINRHLGRETVNRLRFVQDMMPVAPFAPASPPSPEGAEAAARAVSGLPDGPLRDALAALGRAVLAPSTDTVRRP